MPDYKVLNGGLGNFLVVSSKIFFDFENFSVAVEFELLNGIDEKISSIRFDEGLTLETSAFQSLYGGQFTLSTPLINQIFVYHSPIDAAPRFLQKLIAFTLL